MPTLQLPDLFTQRMQLQLRADADAFFQALDQPSPTSIRLNHLKGRHAFPATMPVPWCPSGLYLEERPAFHMDPHWHAGAYYVQEASSMILDHVLRQLPVSNPGKIWLDVCAAPGGKTGILAAHMQPGDVLVANEVVGTRRQILEENLVKAGYPNVLLSGASADAFKAPFVDVMLIDAPCAGEGMMRKDPEAIRQWTPALVDHCSLLQQRIVRDAVHALRPGGFLIYSTCSYSAAENMDNVARFAAAHGLQCLEIPMPEAFGVETLQAGSITGYQLYPHRVRGEGLFIAILARPDEHATGRNAQKHQGLKTMPLPDIFRALVRDLGEYVTLAADPQTPMIPVEVLPQAEIVYRHLPGARWLPEAGERKGKDVVPAHWLAMSPSLSDAVPAVDLPRDAALDYLERLIPRDMPVVAGDWHVVRYDGSVLGWMKSTPQGWRNYYPKAWRLRQRTTGA
jgi:16S rRNA C967 or C1407 C5-methylase (RsmB/RsmF family)